MQSSNSTPQVRLPVEGIWTSGVPWVGWAVYADDPLWKLAAHQSSGQQTPTPVAGEAATGKAEEKGQEALSPEMAIPVAERGSGWEGLPLTIVLSESLFVRQFDYVAYREAIQPLLQQKNCADCPPNCPRGISKMP